MFSKCSVMVIRKFALSSIPLGSIWRFYVLISYPSLVVFIAQMAYTRSWYPNCPNLLRTLFLWNTFLTGILCLLLFIMSPKRQRVTSKIYMLIWFIVNITLTMATLAHILIFRCHISFLSIIAALQTDINESINFFLMYIGHPATWMTLTFSVSYLWMFKVLWQNNPEKPHLSNQRQSRAIAVVALAFLVSMPFLAMKGNGQGLEKNSLVRANFIWRVLIEAHLAKESEDDKAEIVALADKTVDFGVVNLLDKSSRRNYILIVGEGASRHHMSLYGYSRPTSSSLDILRPELLIYNRAISMFGVTAPSLNAAFIFHNIQKGQEGIASILMLYKHAGFKTYWLTNNLAERKGRGAAWFNISADTLVNKNRATSFTQLSSYDMELLPDLQAVLDDTTIPNKFIVLHLGGMHPTYTFRYPPEAAVYADDDTSSLYNATLLSKRRIRQINQYDNAITYNNKNIRCIIDMVAKTPGSNYVLYLSDHSQQLSEVVDSFEGCVATGGTQYMYDIPFILWLSPMYKQENEYFVQYLASGINRFWKMDDSLGHSIAELGRIDFSYFDPEKSIFSPSYRTPDGKLGDGTDYYTLPGPATADTRLEASPSMETRRLNRN